MVLQKHCLLLSSCFDIICFNICSKCIVQHPASEHSAGPLSTPPPPNNKNTISVYLRIQVTVVLVSFVKITLSKKYS